MSIFDLFKKHRGRTPPDLSLRPDIFSFGTGGCFGGYATVEWAWQTLICSNLRNGRATRTVVPTDQQWREFWVAAEKLRLGQWQPCYSNPNIRDGWIWHIKITHWTLKVDTNGDNAAPDDADVTKTVRVRGRANQTYLNLQSAVEGLLGFKLE